MCALRGRQPRHLCSWLFCGTSFWTRNCTPCTDSQLSFAETELSAYIDNLQQAVVDGSEEEILALCRKAAAALAERNRLCKLNKG